MYIFIFFLFIKTIFGIEEIIEIIELKTYIVFESEKSLYKFSNSSNTLLLNHQTELIKELLLYNGDKQPFKTIPSKNNSFNLTDLENSNIIYFKFFFNEESVYKNDKFFIYNYNKSYYISSPFIIQFWNLQYGAINFIVPAENYKLFEISSNQYIQGNKQLKIYNLDNKIEIYNTIQEENILYILNSTYQKSLIIISWGEEDEEYEEYEWDEPPTITISIISFEKYNFSELKENKELRIPIHKEKRLFFIDLQSPENINKTSIIVISSMIYTLKMECYYINYNKIRDNFDEFKKNCTMTEETIKEQKLTNITREVNNDVNGILMEFNPLDFDLNEVYDIIIELYPEEINTNCSKILKPKNQSFFIYNNSYKENTKNLIIYSNQSKNIKFEPNLFNNKPLNPYILPIELFKTYSFIRFTLIGNETDSDLIYFKFTDKKINIYDNSIFNNESIVLSPKDITYYIFTSNNPYKEIVYLDIEYGNLKIYRNNIYKSIEDMFDSKFTIINDYFEINDKEEVYKIIPDEYTRFTFKSFIIQSENPKFNYNNYLYSASFFIKKDINQSFVNDKIGEISEYQIQLFPKNNNTTTKIIIKGEKIIELTNNSPLYKNKSNLTGKNIIIQSNVDTLLTFYFPSSFISKNITKNDLSINKSIVFKFKKEKKNQFKLLKIKNNENKSVNFGYYLSNQENNDNLYYFNQSNLINLKYNERFLIDLDNPSLNDNNYISIYSNNLLNYMYIDFNYTITNLYSQEFIQFNSNLQYKIFEYDYQSDQIESIIMDIIYQNQNNYYEFITIFIDRYRKNIYKFVNDIKSNLNIINENKNEKKNIVYINNVSDFGKGKFYITFYLNIDHEVDDIKNIDLKFKFQLYNPQKYHLIKNETFKLEVGIIENITFHFKVLAKKFNKSYINYDWLNDKNNVKCKINFIISSNADNKYKDEYEISKRGYEKYDYNKDYEITFHCINNSTKKYSLLKLLIYLSDDLSIKEIKNDYKKNSFIIVSPNIVFLFNNITEEGIGEIIKYNLTLSKKNIQPKVLFTESIDYENITNRTDLSGFEKMDILDNNIFTLIKQENNFVIIAIEFDKYNFEPMNEILTYQKIFQTTVPVLGNYTREFNLNKDDIKEFIINEESFFSNHNITILIYSTKNSTIFFENLDFDNRNTNIFIISEKDLKPIIRFKVSSEKVHNFIFKIIYLNENIRYINSNIRKNYYISLNTYDEKENEIYYLGIYSEINSFIYINNLTGSFSIKYKNNINNIDDLLKFDNKTYNYPFIINSSIDLFKFSCSDFCQFEIIFFNNPTKVINLSEGIHIPIYIKENESPSFNLINEFINSIEFEIELIINENNRNIQITFDNNDILELNNTIQKQTIKKDHRNLTFQGDKTYDCLVFISNPLNITIINETKDNSKFYNSYYAFIIKEPKYYFSFSNINIKSNENDKNIYEICYFKSYGKNDAVYKKEYSCHNVTDQKPFLKSIESENYSSELDTEISNYHFYVFYIQNYTNLNYSYNIYDYNTNLYIYQPNEILISKNNFEIYFINITKNDFLEKKNKLTICFNEINKDGILYFYKNRSLISIKNNYFINYIEKKNLNETNNNIFHYENDDLTNNSFYLILQSDLYEIKNTIEIYYNNALIKIEEDCFRHFKFMNSTNFIFSVKNEEKKKLYLHIQWVNLNSNSSVEIKKKNIKSEFNYLLKDNSIIFQLDTQIEYLIIFDENIINNNDKISYLDISFHFYNNQIFNLSEQNSFNISIISKQILYFYIDISEKETIEFVIKKNDKIKYGNPEVKLFNHIKIEDMIFDNNTNHNTINLIEEEEQQLIYSFNKSNKNDISALVTFNINSVNYSQELKGENFIIELISMICRSFTKYFHKNEIGHYYINRSSFKEINEITIYSNKLNKIKFEPKIPENPEYKSFYLIQKEMLEKINAKKINIIFGDNSEEFLIEVIYIDKSSIDVLPIIFNDTKKKVNLTIEKKKNPKLIIFSFRNFSQDDIIIYIEKNDDINIYRNDSIDCFNEFINEYHKYPYSYPVESKKEYEILMFTGRENATITIIFYDYIKGNLDIIKSGMTFPLLITKNTTYNIQFNENISTFFRIKLKKNDMENLYLKVLYNKKKYDLYEDKTIIYDKLNPSCDKVTFNLLKGNAIFIFFSICYEEIKLYSVNKILSQFNDYINVFFYPKNDDSEFGIIYLENEKNESINIEYEEVVSNTKLIFSLDNKIKVTINKNFNYIFKNPINDFNSEYDEEKLIIFYIPNYQFIKFNFNLYKTKNLFNYAKIFLNDTFNYTEIFCYQNNMKKKINLFLNENIKKPVTLYIFNNISNISFTGNNFNNYIITKIFLNNDSIFYSEINDKNLYFIFYIEKLIPLSFNFIDIENRFNLSLKKTHQFELYTNGEENQTFRFLYYSREGDEVINFQSKIFDEKIKGQLEYNCLNRNLFDHSVIGSELLFFFNYMSEEIYNITYTIHNNKKLKKEKIYILFFASDYKNILSFDKKDTFLFPILVKQQYYFIQNLYSILNNETITYKFINCRNIKISISTKLSNENLNDSSNITDYIFEKKKESYYKENVLSYKVSKKESYQFLILKIDFNPINITFENNINAIKDISLTYIYSNQTIKMNCEEKRHFKFFLQSSNYIIINTKDFGALSILSNNDYPVEKNLFIIDEKMNGTEFVSYHNMDDYYLNVTYISTNKKIHVLNRKEIINFSYRILIQNCSIDNYYFGNFNKKKTYLYIEVLYGNVTIKMKNITELEDLDDFFNFENQSEIYQKPIINTNNINFFKFECTNTTLLYIKYYPYNEFIQRNIVIQYGNEFGWLLKNDFEQNFYFRIDNSSEIYQNEFYFEFESIKISKEYNVNFEFNNHSKVLSNNDINFYRDKSDKIESNILKLFTETFESFVIFKIGLNSSSYKTVNYGDKCKLTKENKYVIFFYPEENNTINITIFLNSTQSSGKICLNEGYSDDGYVSFMPTECFEMKIKEKKNFSTYNPYKNNEKSYKIKNSKFYSVFYFEKPEIFEVEFSFRERNISSPTDIIVYVLIIIIIVLILLLIFFIVLYFKKKNQIVMIFILVLFLN